MPDLTNNEHSSVHQVVHNCGHDIHMTMALTSAKYLAENREEMSANVRFIFQMAEEDMRVPGAEKWLNSVAWKALMNLRTS